MNESILFQMNNTRKGGEPKVQRKSFDNDFVPNIQKDNQPPIINEL